jgi:beta-galactosidase GanA
MWYKNAFRRMVIDMHIPDWDEHFLSEFDPQNYIAMLKRAHAQSIVLYAQSHVGLFNYPTKVGVMHRGLKGRNIFGELVELCHQNDIAAVAYTSLIFDRWASNNHPEWRIKLMDGTDAEAKGRFGLCCPNSPYRDYAAQWAEELLSRYPVDGIRFDMTFWPAICYCPYCRDRFAREVGGSLPEVINWEDPTWAAFQRKREEWLADFAGHLTEAAHRARPEASVEHQASTYSLDWKFGVAEKLVPHNDFLQGDFYSDALQGSFVRKLLYNLSPNLPFGFETSAAVTLGNHTNIKSKDLMYAKACAAVAGQCAMIYIDAIDPVGTLNPRVYDRIGSVLSDTMRYDPFRGGELAQDVAVYFSLCSKYNPADNGKTPLDPNLAGWFPHTESLLNTCAALITHHIPFGVVTKRDLKRLSRYRILVLPNVLMMDDEEVKAIRQYVADGGNLYVSKGASLLTETGRRQPDFMLGDVFGVRYQGETQEKFTYAAPEAGFDSLMPEFSKKYPLGLEESQVIVSTRDNARVLAKIVLPYTDPADITRFASIHSNPPGIPTNYPSLVMHSYGKGNVIYSAASLEGAEYARSIFINILKLFQQPYSFEADAPASVEVTLFQQADQNRLIINLLNFQKDLPNIPVDGIKVRVRVTGMTPSELALLPEGPEMMYSYWDDVVEFESPRLETFHMFSLEYIPKLSC